ncbi:MAG: RpiB/LacA/LacB family sugar-phosphate isomerase, partial [Pseudomonadota bacterium]
MRKILIASDHAGFELKQEIIEHLSEYKILDLGTVD